MLSSLNLSVTGKEHFNYEFVVQEYEDIESLFLASNQASGSD